MLKVFKMLEMDSYPKPNPLSARADLNDLMSAIAGNWAQLQIHSSSMVPHFTSANSFSFATNTQHFQDIGMHSYQNEPKPDSSPSPPIKKGQKSEAQSNSNRSRKSSSPKWTPEEDALLMKVMSNIPKEQIVWTHVASQIPGRSAGKQSFFFATPKINQPHLEQCSQHWNRVLKPELKKTPWTLEEEELLYKLTANEKKPNWSKIAQKLNRTGKNKKDDLIQSLIIVLRCSNSIQIFQANESEKNCLDS